MNKRIKKKRTKQARTIINKENRLNKRITNRANRANQRAMRKLSHGIGTSSIEANVTKLFKGIGQTIKDKNEKEQIKQLKTEREAWLSEKLSSLEARYDKKGNLTDNQWSQYERYANELRELITGYGNEEDYKDRPQYDEDITYNDVEYGAIIEKYKEYVDKGWIKESSVLDKYQAAQWFAEQVMTEEEMKEAINRADEWIKKREEKHAKYMADLKAGRLYNFGF